MSHQTEQHVVTVAAELRENLYVQCSFKAVFSCICRLSTLNTYEMGGACGTYGEEEREVQEFGAEPGCKEATSKT
jgi:hypothetical protein